MSKRIKYMGSADVRRLEKGEDFDGRLGTPLSKDVTFSRQNRWVVDTEEVGLSEAAVELLLEEKDGDGGAYFVDVSDKERVPTNLHQQMFLGMKKTVEAPAAPASDDATTDEAPTPATVTTTAPRARTR